MAVVVEPGKLWVAPRPSRPIGTSCLALAVGETRMTMPRSRFWASTIWSFRSTSAAAGYPEKYLTDGMILMSSPNHLVCIEFYWVTKTMSLGRVALQLGPVSSPKALVFSIAGIRGNCIVCVLRVRILPCSSSVIRTFSCLNSRWIRWMHRRGSHACYIRAPSRWNRSGSSWLRSTVRFLVPTCWIRGTRKRSKNRAAK